MGNIKVTQTVNISNGGSGGSSDVLVTLICVVVAAYVLMSVLSALIAALELLFIWLMVVGGVILALAIVLVVVFRSQLKASFGGPRLMYRAEPEPVRPAEPKQELHLHFHGDSEVDKAMLALRAASLTPERRMIAPAVDRDPGASRVISKVIPKRS